MTGPAASAHRALEIWAGVESSHLRVGDRTVDQIRATGHASRPGDLDRLAELGVTAVRYPVLWGWGTHGTETDWAWADRRIQGLLDRGIRPIVELLHHGFGPADIDPFASDYPDRFARYARLVAERYPGLDLLPLNEPLTTARFGGLYGHWWPHRREDRSFVRLLIQQCLAIRAATRAIRELRTGATVIAGEDLGFTQGGAGTRAAVEFDNERRWLTWDLLEGRVDEHHPLSPYLRSVPDVAQGLDALASDPEPPDILGIDHYITSDRYLDLRTELFPPRFRGEGHGLYYADVEAVRVEGASVRPFSRAIEEAWERYGKPLVLAEVQLAGDTAARLAWWDEAVGAAHLARAHEIDLRAVTSWAVFGAWDWSSLLMRQAGEYEPGAFDIRPGGPVATPLAAAVRATSLGRRATGAASHGWWRQRSRVHYLATPARRDPVTEAAIPVLA
jgi:dTDP-4-dehydrorhamnose reductase